MKPTANPLESSTRPVSPALVALLQSVQPGQRLRITQTVRVGRRSWTAPVEGTFREIRCLATGLSTDRVRSDDIVVATIHFTKANGELSSITLDEHSKVEVLGN